MRAARLHAYHEPLTFTLPAASFGRTWDVVIDTAAGLGVTAGTIQAGTSIDVPDRTILVLSRASSAR